MKSESPLFCMQSLAINVTIGYKNKDIMLRNSFKLVSLSKM